MNLFSSAAKLLGGALGVGAAGARTAYWGATRGAAVAANVGITAGESAAAAGYVGYRAGSFLAGGLKSNGSFFTMGEKTMGGRTLRYPTALNRRVQNTVVGLGMAGAIGVGLYQGQPWGKRWNLDQSLATGAVEVETPHFLGATGSLALASAATRRGQPTPEVQPAGTFSTGRRAALMADDVLLMLARRGG